MFYSHTQARAKLPKKRRRIMPVEHLPRSLAVRSNASQLHAHHVAAARAPATLAPGNLSSPLVPGSNFAYYAPGLTAAAAAAAGSAAISGHANVYSLATAPATIGTVGSPTSAGPTLVPRGATLDHHHTRARINLSNKDLLPDCSPTQTTTAAATGGTSAGAQSNASGGEAPGVASGHKATGTGAGSRPPLGLLDAASRGSTELAANTAGATSRPPTGTGADLRACHAETEPGAKKAAAPAATPTRHGSSCSQHSSAETAHETKAEQQRQPAPVGASGRPASLASPAPTSPPPTSSPAKPVIRRDAPPPACAGQLDELATPADQQRAPSGTPTRSQASGKQQRKRKQDPCSGCACSALPCQVAGCGSRLSRRQHQRACCPVQQQQPDWDQFDRVAAAPASRANHHGHLAPSQDGPLTGDRAGKPSSGPNSADSGAVRQQHQMPARSGANEGLGAGANSEPLGAPKAGVDPTPGANSDAGPRHRRRHNSGSTNSDNDSTSAKNDQHHGPGRAGDQHQQKHTEGPGGEHECSFCLLSLDRKDSSDKSTVL